MPFDISSRWDLKKKTKTIPPKKVLLFFIWLFKSEKPVPLDEDINSVHSLGIKSDKEMARKYNWKENVKSDKFFTPGKIHSDCVPWPSVPSDFCYGNEDLTFSISEAIKLCVTVVAYAPESFRR